MTLLPWQTPSHAEAYDLLRVAFLRRFGRPPTQAELEPLAGVGWLETHYGSAWKTPGDGSCNWGAVQCVHPAKVRLPGQTWGDCDSFAYIDTHPQPDGTSTPYRVAFARWESHEGGALGLVAAVYGQRPSVLQAAGRGDLYGVSAELRKTGYYEGWGKTQEDRIQNHLAALRGSIALARGHSTYPVAARVAEPDLLAWQELLEETEQGMTDERDADVRDS